MRDRLVVTSTSTDNALFSAMRAEDVLPPLPPDSDSGGCSLGGFLLVNSSQVFVFTVGTVR